VLPPFTIIPRRTGIDEGASAISKMLIVTGYKRVEFSTACLTKNSEPFYLFCLTISETSKTYSRTTQGMRCVSFLLQRQYHTLLVRQATDRVTLAMRTETRVRPSQRMLQEGGVIFCSQHYHNPQVGRWFRDTD
jgi:hypothetical protein